MFGTGMTKKFFFHSWLVQIIDSEPVGTQGRLYFFRKNKEEILNILKRTKYSSYQLNLGDFIIENKCPFHFAQYKLLGRHSSPSLQEPLVSSLCAACSLAQESLALCLQM